MGTRPSFSPCDDDGRARDAVRGADRVHVREVEALGARDPPHEAAHGKHEEEGRQRGGAVQVVGRHRDHVAERRLQPERRRRGSGGEVDREEGAHRTAVDAEACARDTEAPFGDVEEADEVAGLEKPVRDARSGGGRMAPELGHENVEAEAEGPHRVRRPLGAAAALAVEEEKRAAVCRPARCREESGEARRLARVALVREDLDEPAG